MYPSDYARIAHFDPDDSDRFDSYFLMEDRL